MKTSFHFSHAFYSECFYCWLCGFLPLKVHPKKKMALFFHLSIKICLLMQRIHLMTTPSCGLSCKHHCLIQTKPSSRRPCGDLVPRPYLLSDLICHQNKILAMTSIKNKVELELTFSSSNCHKQYSSHMLSPSTRTLWALTICANAQGCKYHPQKQVKIWWIHLWDKQRCLEQFSSNHNLWKTMDWQWFLAMYCIVIWAYTTEELSLLLLAIINYCS